MNNEFLKMQKLAGLITEGEFKSRLNENKPTLDHSNSQTTNMIKINDIESLGIYNKNSDTLIIDLPSVSPSENKKILNTLKSYGVNYDSEKQPEYEQTRLTIQNASEYFELM
jgi:hypothetical protein